MKNLFLAPLILPLVSLFAQTNITIMPKFQNTPLELNHSYYTADSFCYSFSTIRCYLSDIRGVTLDSEEVQIEKIKLIDLEDSASLILGQTNDKLQSIDFLVGTDSLTNVSGILDGPLDPIRGMYWTWNSGYINFKVEGKVTNSKGLENIFEYHIGGYLPPFATARKVHFEVLQSTSVIQLEIHLDEWLKQIDVLSLPTVMIPGKEAVRLANQLITVFKINNGK